MKTYDIKDIKMTPEQKKKFLEGARKFAAIEHDPEDDQKAPRKSVDVRPKNSSS